MMLFSELLLLLCVCLLHLSSATKRKVYQKADGDFVFLYEGGHAFDIPDLETLHEMGFDEKNVTRIPGEIYEVLDIGKPIQSLKQANGMVDEVMRVKIGRIAALQPIPFWVQQFWLDGHYNGEGAYNPAIVQTTPFKLKDKKVLMSWRSGDDNSVIEMGWYYFNNHSVVKEPRMNVEPLVIDPDTSTMEDARVIEMSSTTIAVIFSGSFSRFSMLLPNYRGTMQLISYGTFNEVTGLYDFKDSKGQSTTRWLKYPENQKNWTPFMHQGELLFFQSINPIHVVKAVKTATSDTDKILAVETVTKSEPVSNLPWDGNVFGGHLRGGSSVVMVRGLMLSFFHTENVMTKINPLKTYFMGVATFCPKAPFQIHSMSQYPILKSGLYEGKWANRYCNYVMFPMGVIVDEKEEFLYVSVGYQDRYGIIIKMEIDGLLDSLEHVASCDVDSTKNS